MVIAGLVFEAGVCRDDPNRLLTYPVRQLLFWYDLCVAWRSEMAKANKRQEQTQQRAQAVTRPLR
jgi:hypothetical protein